jgi:hypothetical protein
VGGGAEAGEGGEVARNHGVTPVWIVSLSHPHDSLYCLSVTMSQRRAAAGEKQIPRFARNDMAPLSAYAAYFHYRD